MEQLEDLLTFQEPGCRGEVLHCLHGVRILIALALLERKWTESGFAKEYAPLGRAGRLVAASATLGTTSYSLGLLRKGQRSAGVP